MVKAKKLIFNQSGKYYGIKACIPNEWASFLNITKEEDIFSGNYDLAVCPNCGYEFCIHDCINFCEKCGQRLDWSDEE